MSRENGMALGLQNPMQRTFMKELKEWKDGGATKAMLVRGERQVGKTFLIRRFAKENYRYFSEFNFYKSKADRDIFVNAGSFESLLMAISLRQSDFKMVKGQSLLFLDEIQECPEAITAVKFLVEETDMDVIMSGSTLGYTFKSPRSYPVGSITFGEMHPMSFEEFLLSQNVDPSVPGMIRQHIRERKPFDKGILAILQAFFREYMIVGGMPECDLYYKLDRRDMDRVIDTQKDIVQSYKEDIMAYSPEDLKLSVSREFDLIPVQLARMNKRVVFSEIEGRANVGLREYRDSIDWISESHFVNPCYNLKAIENPLIEHRDVSSVRLYANDTGLLMNMMGRETMGAILADDIKVNEGAIAENIVSQMIRSQGLETYFFDIKKENLRMEIDFVTMLGPEIAAIEVKSGKSRRSSSIRNLKKTPYGQNVKRFIKFHVGNIVVDEFEHYPMFCAGFMDAMVKDSELSMPERPQGYEKVLRPDDAGSE